jgi:predicted amidohydrolase
MHPEPVNHGEPPSPFRLALIQMHVEGGRPALNLHHAENLLAQAAGQGAQVALLPEALDLGWTHPSARSLATPIPQGEPAQRLAAAAARHRLLICAGLTEKTAHGVYNTAVLFGADGQVLSTHRKLNELTIGHPYYDQGSRLEVVPTPLGNFGLMVCADAFAPGQVLSRALGYMNADVILSPCAWAVPPDHDNNLEPYGKLWRDNYSPVAKDFRIWIIGVSNVGPLLDGPWAGRKCIGSSLAIDHLGQVALQGPYGEDAETVLILNVTPQPRPARGDAWTAHWQQQH